MPASEGPAPRFPTHLHSFHELMQYHVGRILLVSSLYDSFILSEEGQLQETLLGHFIELNLSHAPNIIQASGAREALELLAEDSRFDLVISGVQAGDRDVVRFTRDLRAAGHDMPVLALTPPDSVYQKVISNVEEVKARHGRLILVGAEGDPKLNELAEAVIAMPHVHEDLHPILYVLPLQLLAYQIANRLGCDVDQPRNLAKSVTVE